ncbi:hypothetical protein [Allorhizocola rhizosphaerae]|uniref:hypothetical protein n=1 Tax=Allorhizocola rhizosphaerae TaxID=1872709 RepID=UPI0013C31FDF|nr:hypothetical protein [Allorhizocola rhizosphaerae]
MIVTGAPGSGKSAVVGRIASLSNPLERANIMANAPLSADDPDPGEGSVEAVAVVRGMDHDSVLAQLGRQLQTPFTSVYSILDALTRSGRVPAVIVDAVDEARPADLPRIVEELIIPLSAKCRVIVGTRRSPVRATTGAHPRPTIVDALQSFGTTMDLDLDDDTAAIEEYVLRRLQGTGNTDPATIAREVARHATN